MVDTEDRMCVRTFDPNGYGFPTIYQGLCIMEMATRRILKELSETQKNCSF